MPQITHGRVFKARQAECQACGTRSQPLLWSDLPWPQHCACGGEVTYGTYDIRRVGGVVPDGIPGGMIMEHVEPGRKVYSRTELKHVLATHRSKMWPNGCYLSDCGWTGETDQHFTKGSGVSVDLRTKEDRVREMAAFLGLTVEQYKGKFA